MTEKRDLDYLLNNPDQMTDADIATLMAGEQQGEQTEQGELSAASGTVGKEAESEKVPEDVKSEGEVERAAQVVKSKNGKHEIPYSVLETEREQRRAAEAAVENMRQRLAALEQQSQGARQTPEATEPELSDEDLASISEDFPAVGKLLKGMAARVGELNQRLDEVRQSEHSRRQGEAQRASTTVQEAIDNNPTLSGWQNENPEMFAIAVNFDNQLKSDPRNKGLSMDARFEKVVRAVNAAYGEPDEKPEPTTAKETVAAAPRPAAKTTPATRVPSLSDIPGGVPPETDEITQLGMLSASDLGNKFMTMDPNKILQILAKAA